jgi:hypothetical protein
MASVSLHSIAHGCVCPIRISRVVQLIELDIASGGTESILY